MPCTSNDIPNLIIAPKTSRDAVGLKVEVDRRARQRKVAVDPSCPAAKLVENGPRAADLDPSTRWNRLAKRIAPGPDRRRTRVIPSRKRRNLTIIILIIVTIRLKKRAVTRAKEAARTKARKKNRKKNRRSIATLRVDRIAQKKILHAARPLVITNRVRSRVKSVLKKGPRRQITLLTIRDVYLFIRKLFSRNSSFFVLFAKILNV